MKKMRTLLGGLLLVLLLSSCQPESTPEIAAVEQFGAGVSPAETATNIIIQPTGTPLPTLTPEVNESDHTTPTLTIPPPMTPTAVPPSNPNAPPTVTPQTPPLPLMTPSAIPFPESQLADLELYPPEGCYSAPFPPSSGLSVGQIAAAQLELPGGELMIFTQPTAVGSLATLLPGEQFELLSDPVCFSYRDSAGVTRFMRRWEISTFVFNLIGWVDEYAPPAESPQPLIGSLIDMPPPIIEHLYVEPLYPSRFEEVTLAWTVRRADTVSLRSGSFEVTDLHPLGAYTLRPTDLALDENECATVVLTAFSADHPPVEASRTVCVDPNIDVQVLTLSVSPDPLVGPGLVPATVSWEIAGFDPERHTASLLWFDKAEPYGSLWVTEAAGSATIEIPVELPGGTVVQLAISNGDFEVIHEAYVDISVACTEARMTSDPTLPLDCPTTPILNGPARVQFFEGGTIFWREDAGLLGDERPLIVMYNGNESYAPHPSLWAGQAVTLDEQPPAGLFAPDPAFAPLWLNEPTVGDRLGWAVGEAIQFETTWQVIASHVIIKLPDGQNWRYLLYNGDYGEWLPILADEPS